MTWKDILKVQKYCERHRNDPEPIPIPMKEKEDFERKLIGNQKEIDVNKDGKITGEDFAMLNETKKAKMECPKCKGKGCEHCKDKGYHTKSNSRGPFTDRS